jgi:hypothetical protein
MGVAADGLFAGRGLGRPPRSHKEHMPCILLWERALPAKRPFLPATHPAPHPTSNKRPADAPV